MPSPFLGMDPYLEAPSVWPGLHTHLVSQIAMSLGPKVAPRYYVATEERMYVVDADETRFLGRPDAGVVDGVCESPATYGVSATNAIERPVTVDLPEPD